MPIWAQLAQNGLTIKFIGRNVPGLDLPVKDGRLLAKSSTGETVKSDGEAPNLIPRDIWERLRKQSQIVTQKNPTIQIPSETESIGRSLIIVVREGEWTVVHS
jgi:hypothetical protein